MNEFEKVIHKDLNIHVGEFRVKLRKNKKNLDVKVSCYAERMNATEEFFKLKLIKKKYTHELK